MSGNIKVVCRFRPSNSKEKAKGATEVVHYDDEQTLRIVGNSNHKFDFDRVFPPAITQKEVFDYSAKPVVDDIFKGYNGTIFVYGQTGSGKTHTMQGPDIHDPVMKGIIPRIIENIFFHVEQADEKFEFLVKVSYIEIYMEKIRDLLNPIKSDLKIRENRDKSVYIEGVTEAYVTCDVDVVRLMDEGSGNRKVAATNMNDVSSRSHSVFVLMVQQKDLTNGSTTASTLYLVDLAGSEKVGKTGASGTVLDEAKGINKSLSALGNVINALTDGKSKHIPYRDSKLTRLLQQSLGGNARTTLIINCSPSSYNEEETLSTLRFGTRAKTIKNTAKVNKDMSVAELKELLDKARAEIARLKAYINPLEAELRHFRGDTPVRLPESALAPGNDSAPAARSQPNAPGAAEIQKKYNALEEKLKAEEDEKRELLEKLDVLSDQIRDKENEYEAEMAKMQKLKEELKNSAATSEEYEKENSIMVGKLAELTMAQQKFELERKEAQLNIESLVEEKDTIQHEVEQLRAQMAEFMEYKEKYEEAQAQKAAEAKKAKLEALEREKDNILQGVDTIHKSLENDIGRMDAIADGTAQPVVPGEEMKRIQELERKVAQLAAANKSLSADKARLQRQALTRSGSTAVPSSTTTDPVSLAEELDLGTIHVEGADDLGASGEVIPVVEGGESMGGIESFEMEMLRAEANDSKDLAAKLEAEVSDLRKQLSGREKEVSSQEQAREAESEEGRVKLEAELNELRAKTAMKLAEFDSLKSNLVLELQSRCEKVIDLEMLLDEARVQYEALLKKSSSKSLQKRNVFLERNLEQLTKVHQQLVNQGNALRLEKKVNEKKLEARNERIRGLEVLLQSSQEKLSQQAEMHAAAIAKHKQLENELKAKIEKAAARRQRASSFSNQGHARIARPIRGGGGKKVEPASPTRTGGAVPKRVSAESNGDDLSSDEDDDDDVINTQPQTANAKKTGVRTPVGARTPSSNSATPNSTPGKAAPTASSGGFLSSIFRAKNSDSPATPTTTTPTPASGNDSPFKPATRTSSTT